MSIVDKSRSEIVDELVEYEMGMFKSMTLNSVDEWIKIVLRDGLQGYNQMSDVELAVMYSALLSQQDKDLAEGGE